MARFQSFRTYLISCASPLHLFIAVFPIFGFADAVACEMRGLTGRILTIRLRVSMMLENVFQCGGIEEIFSPLFKLFERGGL